MLITGIDNEIIIFVKDSILLPSTLQIEEFYYPITVISDTVRHNFINFGEQNILLNTLDTEMSIANVKIIPLSCSIIPPL